MHKVTIRPTGQIVEIDEDKTLLQSLKDQGLFINSSCGGHASCSDCIIKIIDGEDYVNTPPFPEVQLMGNVFHITKERLSCQTYVMGDITIDISDHDKTRVDDRLNKKGRGFLKNRAPVNTKVRKKEDVDKMYTERQAIRDEKREKDGEWQKHWEREKDVLAVKKLGGGKRPRLFRTDHLEEKMAEASEENKREQSAPREFREKRDFGDKREFREKRDFGEKREFREKREYGEKRDFREKREFGEKREYKGKRDFNENREYKGKRDFNENREYKGKRDFNENREYKGKRDFNENREYKGKRDFNKGPRPDRDFRRPREEREDGENRGPRTPREDRPRFKDSAFPRPKSSQRDGQAQRKDRGDKAGFPRKDFRKSRKD
ncbi:2Fe-2S iron-sulfur cluster-binding domain protein [Bacteriovorax sp. BSW11_IV]|uniref:2Fe-2S iron-sulfur cluster-binding protein n=1 Tax=Bacteriovorax sp. BSW11_IV TaxID=1353529 RepID=UPI00038A00D0|nr:2Fe-2S iron-sulfur cluster-binding protein [Bacteriovorax sp. BSW11_IV]EQC48505.1 2Fe-2S iron-sulfur cluster-binding domain protein [Bacteriovorax sp. BSW11_IV]